MILPWKLEEKEERKKGSKGTFSIEKYSQKFINGVKDHPSEIKESRP